MQFEKEDAANAATIESSANLDDANRTEHHNTKKTTVSEVNYPSPVKLAFIILSLTLAVFLYGLVRNASTFESLVQGITVQIVLRKQSCEPLGRESFRRVSAN